MSAANAKRASLASTMASSAVASKLRAKFGGGGSNAPVRLVRGSTGWLRNRDAIATAADPRDQPRPLLHASARFGRRNSIAVDLAQLKQRTTTIQEEKAQAPPKQAAASAGVPIAAVTVTAATVSSVNAPPAATAATRGLKESRPAEVDDGISDAERTAWATWHMTTEQLVAAGHDPDVVRAPGVLAAVRTRFLHSPNIMLNSNFDCHFSVDQGAFKRILRRKYGFKATYMPVNYPGMRCPFILHRGVPLDPLLQTGCCAPEDRDLCVKSPVFARRYVKATFILFRTGNAFLRGSFSEDVMTFVYRQFERILVEEYPRICTRSTAPEKKNANSVVKTRVAYFGWKKW